MRLFSKRTYTKHEIVVGHSWITYYQKFKNFNYGKAIIIHTPIPFYSTQYDVSYDEFRSGWRFGVFILSWYPHRIMLDYGSILIKELFK